jgi:hypothetical protein
MVDVAVKHALFVSYDSADRRWVEGFLLDALDSGDVDFVSEASFELGRPRITEFERAMRESRSTLLVLSRAYLNGAWNHFVEVLIMSYGLDTATWPVIPLLLEPVELPEHLRILVALDATEPLYYRSVLERLFDHLQRQVPPAVVPPCPYLGLRAFEEQDSDRFFGRSSEVQSLLDRLSISAFVTVIGPSGCGKSSLVHAGLVPAVRGSRLFGPGEWRVRTVRPGTTPGTELLESLQVSTIPAEELPGGESRPLTPTRVLLVVDQFEEVFGLDPPSLGSFNAALETLSEMHACYVVLTVRADFYGELMQTPIWRRIEANLVPLLPLNDAGLRHAILDPAEAPGINVYIDAAVVERLIADAQHEPGAAPLIQETLVRLWQHLERRYLPLEAYESLEQQATVDGEPRTPLQWAMQLHGDAAIGQLPSSREEAIARRILLDLVQLGEGRPDTRRQRSVQQLLDPRDDPREFRATLEVLTRERLVTLGGRSGSPDQQVVDLAHESLIQNWPRMQRWIRDIGRADLVLARQLRHHADEWDDHARDERLLYGGSRLTDARAYAERQRTELRPNEVAFLAASGSHERARERARYLGQTAGGAIGVGSGYLLAFGIALTVTDVFNGSGSNATPLLLQISLNFFAVGAVVGGSIGLSLWLARKSPLGRRIIPALVGTVVGAVVLVVYQHLFQSASLDLSDPNAHVALRAAAGACLGLGSSLSVVLGRRRWQHLAFGTLGGAVATIAAAHTHGVPWEQEGTSLLMASGVALGACASMGFALTAADAGP